MTKEEFNKIWKDSTKEQILNQYYYDYEEMIKSHSIIKEVREYIKEHTTQYISYLGKEHKEVPKIELQREAYDKLLEILDKEKV